VIERKEIYLVVHGHFYQPPRQNPWTGAVERQLAASPFHDWNEKIAAECYIPNTLSRLLDERGMIDDVVNNFEYINFNIGPTLFSWLEQFERKTYELILAADRLSRKRNGGHGNAIAQVYNHIIMPLAGRQDQITQIKWGVADFRARFAREPEGMWLAETAVNNETARLLAEQGIKFTVLSPAQAEAVRPIGSGRWRDVSDGGIDTTRPYRLFFPDGKGEVSPDRYLDIFFFNKEVSSEMSFRHLLRSAESLARRLASVVKETAEPQLINVATDGETFGHHEPFADMCLAYFFRRLAGANNFIVTNYANYLEMHPPEFEVTLQKGEEGKGTSWSCVHGVGRWERDCGCSTGGRPAWNQKWRTPLRRALNLLKEKADSVFEKEAKRYLTEPWKARNDYYSVIFNRSPETVREFLKVHALRRLTEGEITETLKLMEAAHNSMLMFASCGWFFSDISGIEAIQNLKHAGKVFQLLGDYFEPGVYKKFLTILREAKSNVASFGSGKDIYERFVAGAAITEEKVASSFAFGKLLTSQLYARLLPSFCIREIQSESVPDKHRSLAGELEIENRELFARARFVYYVIKLSLRDIRCYVTKLTDAADYEHIIQLLQNSDKMRLPEIFEGRYCGWESVISTISEKIMRALLDEDLDRLQQEFAGLYEKRKDLFEIYRETGLALPPELHTIMRSSLSLMLYKEFLSLRGKWEAGLFQNAAEIIEEAAKCGVKLDTADIRALVEEDLAAQASAFASRLDERALQNLVSIFEVGKMLRLPLRRDTVENVILLALEEKVMPMIRALKDVEIDLENYNKTDRILEGVEKLNISRVRFDRVLAGFKKRLLEEGKTE